MKKDDCIFCKIANGDIPSRKLYEDDKFVVIMDLAPASKGHSLIIPKEHYANIYEMPEELLTEVIKLAKNMAVKMTDALQAAGFNIIQNNNEAAGQTVFHFHMHLIPRFKDNADCIIMKPGSATAEEMDAIKDLILK